MLGGRLQVLLDALVVVHLSWDWDGDRGTVSAAGEWASPAVWREGEAIKHRALGSLGQHDRADTLDNLLGARSGIHVTIMVI